MRPFCNHIPEKEKGNMHQVINSILSNHEFRTEVDSTEIDKHKRKDGCTD